MILQGESESIFTQTGEMTMRKILRSILSGTLALSMALPQPIQALAEVAE